MSIVSTIQSWFGKDKPVSIEPKNKTFQSCFYCSTGGASYRLDLDNGDVVYVCENHRKQYHSDMTIDSTVEKDFPVLIL